MTQAANIKVFQIYIKAPAAKIWEAITSPSWNARYGYRGPMHYDLRPGGRFEAHANADMLKFGLPEVIIDGEVLVSEPPHKLVQTYRFLFDDKGKEEGFTTLTWEIEETSAGFCRVCITHDFGSADAMARAASSNFNEQGGGGWGWILSDLKTLLETGAPMAW
jgi:uncharacterized protein YndB with AHSA1/START domain